MIYGSKLIDIFGTKIEANTAFFKIIISYLLDHMVEYTSEKETRQFVKAVGLNIANIVSHNTKEKSEKIDLKQVAEELVEFKNHIGGAFSIQHVTDTEIRLTNQTCPFQEAVLDRPALCEMTTNVLGKMTSNSTGYARVRLEKAIANGDNQCVVCIRVRADETTPDHEESEFFN